MDIGHGSNLRSRSTGLRTPHSIEELPIYLHTLRVIFIALIYLGVCLISPTIDYYSSILIPTEDSQYLSSLRDAESEWIPRDSMTLTSAMYLIDRMAVDHSRILDSRHDQ